MAGFKDDSGALQFSPDGKFLFGAIRSFTAASVALADGFVHHSKSISSWLHTARFVDAKTVVATGAHGLGVLAQDKAEMVKLDDDAGEGMAVSPSGRFVCAGARSERLVCFHKGKRPAKTRYRSAPKSKATPPAAAVQPV